MFHVSQLDSYTPLVTDQLLSEPHPEMQEKILAVIIDRIDAINGQNQKATAVIWRDLKMVINDEDV
jgi:hypothetical protein